MIALQFLASKHSRHWTAILRPQSGQVAPVTLVDMARVARAHVAGVVPAVPGTQQLQM